MANVLVVEGNMIRVAVAGAAGEIWVRRARVVPAAGVAAVVRVVGGAHRQRLRLGGLIFEFFVGF